LERTQESVKLDDVHERAGPALEFRSQEHAPGTLPSATVRESHDAKGASRTGNDKFLGKKSTKPQRLPEVKVAKSESKVVAPSARKQAEGKSQSHSKFLTSAFLREVVYPNFGDSPFAAITLIFCSKLEHYLACSRVCCHGVW
ncbi:MAG: hypothetical protein ACRDL7_15880, partial [Gaiellaceae bacterium]